MATKEMVKYCEAIADIIGLKQPKRKHYKIDTSFFFIKDVVKQSKVLKLSECEKRRHETENQMLLTHYTETYPKAVIVSIRERFGAEINALKRPAKVFKNPAFSVLNP
jgi:Ser/Thr protein kinase RdoA (MazF antagonist)